MGFELTCDVVSGALPRSRPNFEAWLVENAFRFGIQFLGDSDKELAGALLDALATDEERNDAEESCKRLPNSGF